MKIEASFTPNTEVKVVYTASHVTFDTRLFKEGQTLKMHTIYKNPVIFAHIEDGTEMTHLEFIIQGNVMNLKMVQLKGKLQETCWFGAGPVESTFLVKGNDYQFNIVFNTNKRMMSKRFGRFYDMKLPKEWVADNNVWNQIRTKSNGC